MTRKNLLLAGLLSVIALGGVAVTAHAMTDNGPMRADTNGDGVVSRSEYFAAAETRFTRQDANADRKLSGDEMMDRGGRFARQDTNNDGSLSFAEASTNAATRFGKLDANADGKLTPEEMRPRHGRHGGRGPDGAGPGMAQDDGPRPAPGAGPGMGLKRLDTNGHGKISRDEMRAQADQRFDRMDANKDGVIDQSEMQATRGIAGERRGGGRRGLRQQGMDDMPPPPAPTDQ